MVMLFSWRIFAAPLIPAVQHHLSQTIFTVPANPDPPRPQQICGYTNSVRHGILCPNNPESIPLQNLNKTCRRRIHNDSFDVSSIREPFQIFRIFRIGSLLSRSVRIVIILANAVPHISTLTPQAKRCRICGSVIHRNTPSGKIPLRWVHRIPIRIEKVIDQTLRRRPFSQHKSSVKHTGICPFIPGPYSG